MVGDAAVRYADQLTAAAQVLPLPLLGPAIARLGRRLAEEPGPHLPHHLQPLYVRRPDVERALPPEPSTP